MKTIIFALTLIALCSCSMNSKSLKDENEQSIKEFAITGQSTNCDILRKLKEPVEKRIYSNGNYMYLYNFVDTSLISAIPSFKRTIIAEYRTKSVGFTFNRNNILSDIEWNIVDKMQVSKYTFMDIPFKPEIKDIRKIKTEEFLQKIAPGMKKGTLFRITGKPDISYEYHGKEKWLFQQQSRREWAEEISEKEFKLKNEMFGEYKVLFSELSNRPAKKEKTEYVIILKDNAVIDRYVSKITDLTNEEDSCSYRTNQ